MRHYRDVQLADSEDVWVHLVALDASSSFSVGELVTLGVAAKDVVMVVGEGEFAALKTSLQDVFGAAVEKIFAVVLSDVMAIENGRAIVCSIVTAIVTGTVIAIIIVFVIATSAAAAAAATAAYLRKQFPFARVVIPDGNYFLNAAL